MTETFSGCHPYRPQDAISKIVADFSGPGSGGLDSMLHAVALVERITSQIDSGICPRCCGPLPALPIKPSGSRATACRCVPICGRCGEDEANQGMLCTRLSGIWQWPVGKGAITRRANKVAAQSTPATLIATGGTLKMLTEDGVQDVTLAPPRSGGWAQHGYDDTADQSEVAR